MLDKVKPELKKLLHLGCGGSYLDKLPLGFQHGFKELRLDIDASVNPDYLMSANDLSGLPSGEFDALYSSHMIEHVYPYQTVDMLKSFKRILKPDGFLVLTCPDILRIAQMIVEGNIKKPAYKYTGGLIYPADILYGHQEAIKNGKEYMSHKNCFTAQSLTEDCVSAGFGTVQVRRRDEKLDLWAICIPNKTTASHAKELMLQFTFA